MIVHRRAVGLALAIFVSASWWAFAQNRTSRDVRPFESIAVGGGIDLVLRQGERLSLEVESAGDSSDIVTEVRSGTLEIGHKRSFFNFGSWGDHTTVHVTAPKLVALTASGGSDVTAEGTFSGDALRINASGGSDVAIAVSVDTLDARASGGADLMLSGSARSARLESSGGSDVDASRLTANEANLQSSGGSDLAVTVRDSLVAHASGGSDISYGGKPSAVQVDTSGGAKVRPR